MENRETVFAAWLINMDRFLDGGPLQMVKRCGSVLRRFLDIDVVEGILEGRDEYRQQRNIVDAALQLSLCESERREKTSRGKSLTSVFSRVTVRDGDEQKKMYYPVSVERVDAAFPVEKIDDSAIRKLSGEFEKEIAAMEKDCPRSWEDFILLFDGLVRKYMWCITASDYEGEDISLYNQSRIAAAIAACVLRCGSEEENCYKLVVGDFSGIQKYVFSVANVSESGVAKRLRARSFYVDAAVSVIAQDIIHRFGLTQNHILMLTGGKFYLLLPNVAGSDQLLSSIEAEIERSFFKQFGGQIAIHLAWLTMPEEGLRDYSRSVTEVMRILGEKKSRSFKHILTDGTGWNRESFILSRDLADKHICSSCGSELTDKEQQYCGNCRMQTEIGGKLPHTRYIAYYRVPEGESDHGMRNCYHVYGDYWIGLWTEFRRDHAFLVEQVNGERLPKDTGGYPVRIRYMANHIPVNENGEVITFGDMAQDARGTKKLAVLKADVDSLGYIFADGLRKGQRHYGTISRVNTMSRLLEVFFSGYINELLTEAPEYSNVYSVFSGGDDLFLIGPWDVMPKLAVQIEKDFRRFAADNPALTLSAAVSVFSPREHIAHLAEYSEQTLKKVKNSTVEVLYPQKSGRDGVSFLGELMAWDDLEDQLDIGDRLTELLQKNLIGISTLRRIGTYSRMYRKFLIDRDVMALMFEPLFHYDRERNYDDIRKKMRDNEDLEWFLNGYVKDLAENAADLRKVKKNLYFAETAVIYAMNMTKEEREHGTI